MMRHFFVLFVFATLIVGMVGCGAGSSHSDEALTPPTATVPAPTNTPTLVPTVRPTNTPSPQPTATPTPQNVWDDRIFYEVFVRSFYDADGDGKGDLAGLIERLDYLNDGDPLTDDDLGVTGLWLMPIMQSPSYHGYDVTDYFAVDDEYGTREQFAQLIEAAHARDMLVIVDLVLNHTSVAHPWFVEAVGSAESPLRDYYVWSDDPRGTGWHETENGSYFGIFWEGMPDLNVENETVSAELREIGRFWLEEMGVDGFRLDAIKHMIEVDGVYENTSETVAWMADYQAYLTSVKPDVMTVGEVWSSAYDSSKYVNEQAVDLAFDFDIAKGILATARGDRRNAQSAYATALDLYDGGDFATFITNHDQNRVMSQLGNTARAKVAATILLTSPGLPFIYYGEEIGMTGQKPDEQIRTPMQWSAETHAGFSSAEPWHPLTDTWQTDNVAAQTEDPESLLNLYRTLIRLRQTHAALSGGDWQVIDSDQRKIYAHLRTSSDEAVVTVINIGDAPIESFELQLPDSLGQGGWQASALFGRTPAQLPVSGGYTPFDGMAAGEIGVILFEREK